MLECGHVYHACCHPNRWMSCALCQTAVGEGVEEATAKAHPALAALTAACDGGPAAATEEGGAGLRELGAGALQAKAEEHRRRVREQRAREGTACPNRKPPTDDRRTQEQQGPEAAARQAGEGQEGWLRGTTRPQSPPRGSGVAEAEERRERLALLRGRR